MKREIQVLGALFLTASGIFTDLKAQKDSVKTNNIEETVIIGSRTKNRVSTDVPAAVDIFDVASMVTTVPQNSVTQILNYVAPSFTSNPVAAAYGTDHIDPAQLRGLGPDQVLVLVNGKRRHTSALVNINGSPGRGSVFRICQDTRHPQPKAGKIQERESGLHL